MTTSGVTVSVSKGWLNETSLGFGIKIQTSNFELNVWVSQQEILLLQQVKNARWEERGSLQIGVSAGSPAFWACKEGQLSVLVGSDDECWDFGVTIPITVVDDIFVDLDNQDLSVEPDVILPG